MNYNTTYFAELSAAIGNLDLNELHKLYGFVRNCAGTLWVVGNGGSMANAQHWACDLSKAANLDARALGSNPGLLTAWANDSDYANVFGAELTRSIRADDHLIALTCSGTSPSTHYAIREALARHVPVFMVTSVLQKGTFPLWHTLKVQSTNYGIIEDCHLAIGHWLTEILRNEAQQQ